jgi:RNA polymerase sigma-70 factor (ECF subfamily)
MPDQLDRELLRRFVRGDQDAFESLFRQFEPEVYRWILRIVRSASSAEDILIEAFWRAYRGRASFDSSRSFGAWMRRIATNAACDHLRVMRPRANWITTVDGIEGSNSADCVLGESITLAFRRLPPKLQVVATLALIEGHSHAEIAEALDLPIGTVKSRLFRAIYSLRKELARLGIRHE